jgi:hypothetical protein
MTDALPPFYLKAMRQNGHNADCAVATIATLCGINYEESLAACVTVAPDVLLFGMTWPEIRKACEALGVETTIKRAGRYDISEDTGILHVRKPKVSHVVFLWAGRIIDGNMEMWLEPDDYLRHYKWTAQSLLVRA